MRSLPINTSIKPGFVHSSPSNRFQRACPGGGPFPRWSRRHREHGRSVIVISRLERSRSARSGASAPDRSRAPGLSLSASLRGRVPAPCAAKRHASRPRRRRRGHRAPPRGQRRLSAGEDTGEVPLARRRRRHPGSLRRPPRRPSDGARGRGDVLRHRERPARAVACDGHCDHLASGRSVPWPGRRRAGGFLASFVRLGRRALSVVRRSSGNHTSPGSGRRYSGLAARGDGPGRVRGGAARPHVRRERSAGAVRTARGPAPAVPGLRPGPTARTRTSHRA
jgi:hypothetical protein